MTAPEQINERRHDEHDEVNGPYDNLADRLDAVAEELDEVMFDQLREASAARGARPVDDKRLTQARRAIEKASRLLRGSVDD